MLVLYASLCQNILSELSVSELQYDNGKFGSSLNKNLIIAEILYTPKNIGFHTMNKFSIRPKTVKLIARFIRPLTDEGLITVPEQNTILSNLKHLAERGKLTPQVVPQLIDQREAAAMLGLGHSNFKKLEKEGAFPFNRRMVGSSVRYRNIDIIAYIMADE
jgi:predicted DNA-binding transcriptional regulator AlpA